MFLQDEAVCGEAFQICLPHTLCSNAQFDVIITSIDGV